MRPHRSASSGGNKLPVSGSIAWPRLLVRIAVISGMTTFSNRGSCWSAAFGTVCANVANSLVAIVTAGSAATPARIDRVANAIVEAIAPLIDDFEVARRAARAAIEAIAS
jgi:hypothetical protein